MHARFLMPALLFAALSWPAAAITLGQEDIPDPIKPGATCAVPVPGSYGSYIYDFPSKYDLVFWPHAAANMIWFCPESGFASFIGDADTLSDTDKAALTQHLAANYRKGATPPTELEKLALLRQSYAHRRQDEAPRIAMLRALGYMYEAAGDAKNAEALRREALAAIHARLAGSDLDEQTRLEYLFVSAAYEREFGDPGALGCAVESAGFGVGGSERRQAQELCRVSGQATSRCAPDPTGRRPRAAGDGRGSLRRVRAERSRARAAGSALLAFHPCLRRPQRTIGKDRMEALRTEFPKLRQGFGHLVRNEADAAGLAIQAGHELLQRRLRYRIGFQAVDAELAVAIASRSGFGVLPMVRAVERGDQQRLRTQLHGVAAARACAGARVVSRVGGSGHRQSDCEPMSR